MFPLNNSWSSSSLFKDLEILHCVQFLLFTSLELIRTAIRVYECASKFSLFEERRSRLHFHKNMQSSLWKHYNKQYILQFIYQLFTIVPLILPQQDIFLTCHVLKHKKVDRI